MDKNAFLSYCLHMISPDLKQRFLRVYSTLPLGVRKEIVVVLDPPVGPVSWEAAYLEIEQETELAEKILEKLDRLQVI